MFGLFNVRGQLSIKKTDSFITLKEELAVQLVKCVELTKMAQKLILRRKLQPHKKSSFLDLIKMVSFFNTMSIREKEKKLIFQMEPFIHSITVCKIF
ncbi:hypothetical protein KONIH1_09225 [Klebsiella oxytoca KONIH1]|nr:hypothetical protein KONIH1_09225 [Klebsiella oxytoca KONIH1]AUV93305.1 hypothetical protein C2U44_20785 [Klebsiella oxytoca]AXO53796.1 hypothetical protein AXA58_02955 [Klebsiella pneumoniae]PNR99047.1 hypothetical protein GZ73_28610 [Klebsiella pneumoniae]POT85579.1 hypothetical protein C3417_23475 [Klebsiella oxytoca]